MLHSKFFIIAMAFICLPLFSASSEEKPTDPITIPIKLKKPNQPRTPDFGGDIMAYYQDGVVYLQFTYNMGNVEITVTNESTGEQWQQTEDTVFGSASIATSTSAGDYSITIVSDDATCYSGYFYI